MDNRAAPSRQTPEGEVYSRKITAIDFALRAICLIGCEADRDHEAKNILNIHILPLLEKKNV